MNALLQKSSIGGGENFCGTVIRQHAAYSAGSADALRSFGRGRNDIQSQVEGYLRAIGVTARDLAAIRALLTEPRGPGDRER